MKKSARKQHGANQPLVVRSERVAEPDWDRYLAALVAFALRRVEEATAAKEKADE